MVICISDTFLPYAQITHKDFIDSDHSRIISYALKRVLPISSVSHILTKIKTDLLGKSGNPSTDDCLAIIVHSSSVPNDRLIVILQ